jgi:transposase
LPRPKAPPASASNAALDRSLPEHLPREQHEIRRQVSSAHHDALGQPCGCTACGGRLRSLGIDVSHHLEYLPGRFKVVRTVAAEAGVLEVRGDPPGRSAEPPDPSGLGQRRAAGTRHGQQILAA